MTLTATRDRVAATARAVRWTVPLAAFGLVVLLLIWRRTDLATESGALGVSRVIGVLLVVGVLPLLDDPSTRQVASVPLLFWVREAPRLITMVVLVLVPVWVLALATGLPASAVLLETGCILALATGAALLMRRATDQGEPSTVVSVGVLVLPAAMYLLPARFAFYASPGPSWTDAHVRWAVLLGIGLLLVAYALRDPASRQLTRLGRLSSEPGERVASGAATRR